MSGISVKPTSTRISITFGVTTEHVTADEAGLLADALLKAIPDHAKLRLAELDDQDAKLREIIAANDAERAGLTVLIQPSPFPPRPDPAPAEPVEADPVAVEPEAPAVMPEPPAPAAEALVDPTATLTLAQTRMINHYLSQSFSVAEIAEMVGVSEAAVKSLKSQRGGKRKAG